jgi:hypothetical protein
MSSRDTGFNIPPEEEETAVEPAPDGVCNDDLVEPSLDLPRRLVLPPLDEEEEEDGFFFVRGVKFKSSSM